VEATINKLWPNGEVTEEKKKEFRELWIISQKPKDYILQFIRDSLNEALDFYLSNNTSLLGVPQDIKFYRTWVDPVQDNKLLIDLINSIVRNKYL
jgi:hypothetical protein